MRVIKQYNQSPPLALLCTGTQHTQMHKQHMYTPKTQTHIFIHTPKSILHIFRKQ